MDEQVLRDFFVGDASGQDLAANVHGSVSHPRNKISIVHIGEMNDEFTVTREMAVKLCDAVLNGDLPPKDLATIGFALIAFDHFAWDEDDLIANVVADWSCPEINYPLTLENIARFKTVALGNRTESGTASFSTRQSWASRIREEEAGDQSGSQQP